LDSITREEVYYMQKAEFTCHSLWKICLYWGPISKLLQKSNLLDIPTFSRYST
jgi:hypothetical protein